MSEKKEEKKEQVFEDQRPPEPEERNKPYFGLEQNPIDEDGNIKPLFDLALNGTYWGKLLDASPEGPDKDRLVANIKMMCDKGDGMLASFMKMAKDPKVLDAINSRSSHTENMINQAKKMAERRNHEIFNNAEEAAWSTVKADDNKDD